MSRKIPVGSRVKVISVPGELDNDLLGLEGFVVPQDAAAALLGLDYIVVLDNRPDRLEASGIPFNFFLDGELEKI